MMRTTYRLGPFAGSRVIGHGAMGDVWLGQHVAQEVPVAIKVLTGKLVREEAYVAAFRAEVRAVAKLNHPGIVKVFDYGLIGQRAEMASAGRLRAGSPYLVMEYASGGTLKETHTIARWSDFKKVALQILDALAHAHARGVVHRDLKPDNVLVTDDEHGEKRLVLADFGIAHAIDRQPSRRRDVELLAGTPEYMAPEQCLSRWRDYGPWTDLYALGVMGYELSAGYRPYQEYEANVFELTRAQLNEPLPALRPRFRVPDGFTGWLHRLTAKDSRHRFRCAADAAWALHQLGSPQTGPTGDLSSRVSRDRRPAAPNPLFGPGGGPSDRRGSPGLFEPIDSDPLVSSSRATRPVSPLVLRGLAGRESAEPDPAGAPALGGPDPLARVPRRRSTLLTLPEFAGRGVPTVARRLTSQWRPVPSKASGDLPPVPDDWARPDPQEFDHLTGAGQGLVGMRTVPMVGRESERDLLWDLLHEVRDTGAARLVVVRGVAGMGKSRLARWLCERAHEVGAAEVLRATHGQADRGLEGLASLTTEWFRAAGLDREAVKRRVDGLHLASGTEQDAASIEALVDLMAPRGGPTGEQDPFVELEFGQEADLRQSANRRFSAVWWLLRQVTSKRAAVVWLDDVQWGPVTLAFSRFALEIQHRAPAPVLFVLTVQEEALAEQPSAARALTELVGRADASQIRLGPLAPDDHTDLLRRFLGLSSEVITALAKRTAGNPLFAEQLIVDWVQRGILRATPDGFHLDPGADVDLPDSVQEVWRRRVDRLLAGLGSPGRLALEVAAALGRRVDAVEWVRVCRELGASVSGELLERLLEQRLADATAEGFAFIHGMLRESVGLTSRECDRWESINEACARVLAAERARQPRPGLAERSARHLLEAGLDEEALEPLLEASRECIAEGSFQRAAALLANREAALDRLWVDEADERRLLGALPAIFVDMQLTRHEEAVRGAERVECLASQIGRDDLRVAALFERGRAVWHRGQMDEAQALFEQVVENAEAADRPAFKAQALLQLADIDLNQGQLDRAERRCRQASELAEQSGADPKLVHRTQLYGGAIELARGRPKAAQPVLQAGYEGFLEAGEHYLAICCLNGLAEVDRLEGRLEAAEAGYRRCIEGFDAAGAAVQVNRVLSNLGITLVALGHYEAAREPLSQALDGYRRTGQEKFVAGGLLNLLPALAGAGDWESYQEAIEEATRRTAERLYVSPDDAWTALRAAQLAEERDQPGRAVGAYRLALQHYEALAREDEAEQARSAIARLADADADPRGLDS